MPQTGDKLIRKMMRAGNFFIISVLEAGVAALDDKARNDAVKSEASVKRLPIFRGEGAFREAGEISASEGAWV